MPFGAVAVAPTAQAVDNFGQAVIVLEATAPHDAGPPAPWGVAVPDSTTTDPGHQRSQSPGRAPSRGLASERGRRQWRRCEAVA